MKFMQRLTGETNKLFNSTIFLVLVFIATMIFAFFRNEWLKIDPSMQEVWEELDNLSTEALILLLGIFLVIYKITKRISKKVIKKH